MSSITQFTPTYKLIDKTKNTIVPITIKGDVAGDLLPFRSSCRVSDVIGKAGTYNATLVLRSDDGIFIDNGPILVDENAKFKFLIEIQYFQPKDIGLVTQDNLGFKSRLFRCEISNATIDVGRKGRHISLELTAYDIRLEETLDAERHELFTPKQSFLDRILNANSRRDESIPPATVTVNFTGDTVTSLTPVDKGRSYQLPPTVTIGAPTGGGLQVQATADAVLGTGDESDKVVSYVITNVGDGYAGVETTTVDTPFAGPFFDFGDVGEAGIELPDDERLKQDWIPSKPTTTKILLDEIIDKISRPEIIGSENRDYYYFSEADVINPQRISMTAKQFGEVDSGVTIQDEDIDITGNQSMEKTKQSDFNNRKYKNVLIARGKSGSQTLPQEFGILSSDLNHARFASDYDAFTTYEKGDYVKSGNDRFKSLGDDNTGNTPAASPFAWENLSTSTKGTPWTIDDEVWITSMAGFESNKITGGSGTGAVIRPIFADGIMTGSRITSGGTGYVNGESLLVQVIIGTAPTVTAIVTDGVITGITIVDPGSNLIVGFFTDMNIARGNYDRDDEFNEFEKISVKDVESVEFSDPVDIPSGEIQEGRRWLVFGTGAGDWVGQDNRIAQREGNLWKFSNAPQFIAGTPDTMDVINDLRFGRVYGYNGTSWFPIWSIEGTPKVSSPFHAVETVEKVANRIGLNTAVEFTFNWNTFDLSDILQILLRGVQISNPVGVPLQLLGIDVSSVDNSTTLAAFRTLLGNPTDQDLLDIFGVGNVKNHSSRTLIWNLKLPFPRREITTQVKTYEVGDLIKSPLIDWENLSETIDKNLTGWNRGDETQNLGNLRGVEWWQRSTFLNASKVAQPIPQPINGLADLPFLLCFRDKFDTIVYKEITQRSHARWGKFRVTAGPNAGMKIFDSRIDELFTLLGFTFPDNFFIEQRELTGVKFDWRRVKEVFCVYKGSYDDNFFYKAGQNAFFDTFNEHATQVFKDLSVAFTAGLLDEEEVIVDKAKIAIDDFHFIKDGYISSSDDTEADSRISFVDLPNQTDYVNVKKTILPRLLSRKQFHPEIQITDCIGNVRLRAGQSYTLNDSTVSEPTKLTPIEVIHIDDGNGYNNQLTSIRKYEDPG